MKTKAVRLYGKRDMRLESFDLPPINEDEILVRVVSDSLCMSSYKMAIQGEDHKRVPADISTRPIIVGHEFCGDIVEVGKKWQNEFKAGEKFTIQPALNLPGTLISPGYSYPYMGGDATYMILVKEVMELGCMLHYDNDSYYFGSLSEPMSCIMGAFNAVYHVAQGSYDHKMGVVEGGNMAILAGAGPMGLGAIDLALHGDRRPSQLVVTDIDEARLQRAASIFTVEDARRDGITLRYVNTKDMADPAKELLAYTDRKGYDDVFVFAPVSSVVELGDAILGNGGCLNFFSGPTDPAFSAKVNFYNVHYNNTHILGTTGGNTQDLLDCLDLMNSGRINPSAMVTHVGGLDCVAEATANLPNIPGGKKLVYTHVKMPLTALTDFEELGKKDPMFAELAQSIKAHNGLWNPEAEKIILAKAPSIE